MKSIDFGIQIDPFTHFGIKHISLKTKHNNFYQTFQYLSSGTTSKKPNEKTQKMFQNINFGPFVTFWGLMRIFLRNPSHTDILMHVIRYNFKKC